MTRKENKKWFTLASIGLWLFIMLLFGNLLFGKYSFKNLSLAIKEKQNLQTQLAGVELDIKHIKNDISLIDQHGNIDRDLLEEISQRKLSKMPADSYILKRNLNKNQQL